VRVRSALALQCLDVWGFDQIGIRGTYSDLHSMFPLTVGEYLDVYMVECACSFARQGRLMRLHGALKRT
jgi:hypothetical protein